MSQFEEQFISGLLSDYKAYFHLCEKIKVDYFLDQTLRGFYKEIKKLDSEGFTPDLTSLGARVSDKVRLFDVASNFVSSIETMEFLVSKLSEDYTRNFLERKAKKVINLLETPETPLEDILEVEAHKPAQARADSLETANSVIGSTLVKMDAIIRGDQIKFNSGSAFFDDFTDGLEEGSVNYIGARPGNGKTSFVVDMLHNFKQKAVFYSLEMNQWEIGRRMISRSTGFSSAELKEKYFLDKNKKIIIEASKEISQRQIFIDSTPGKTPDQILSECKYIKAKQGLDLVVVDYIQIMKLGRKAESKTIEIGYISQALKDMAKKIDCRFVVLSQIGRMQDGRGDKRPTLSDMRWSGEIEENAHKVGLLHIPSKYGEADKHLCEIILAKNRSGESDYITNFYIDWRSCEFRPYTFEDSQRYEASKFQKA